MFSSAGSVLLLAFGFGFVIFWHELGHFLAAKWADVKVEQFAVGFGQALFSWRKGLGFRWGSTQTDYQSKLRDEVERTAAGQPQLPEQASGPSEEQLAAAGDTLGISETEYRLNWIPLGGYVKMLGQDDLRPGEQVANPRSYTAKPVGKRMVIVSAGVIMNVILAAIGFMVLFTVGYKVPQATVGQVVPGSPAQRTTRVVDGKPAPVLAGDTIQRVDGRWQASFDKIKLNTPLLIPGEAVPIDVVRVADGRVDHLMVTPVMATPESEFPQLGIAAAHALRGLTADDLKELPKGAIEPNPDLRPAELYLFKVGDTITVVAGEPVTANQEYKLTDALQAAGGRPVPVTVRGADGRVRTVEVPAHFADPFGDAAVDFAGLEMLPQVLAVDADSPLASGKDAKGVDRAGARPGDVIVEVADVDASGGKRSYTARDALDKFVQQAVQGSSQLRVSVLRDGARVTLPAVRLGSKHPGLAMEFGTFEAEPIVAAPPPGSPAEIAQVPGGAVLRTVDGQPVRNWFDVYAVLRKVDAGRAVPLTATVNGQLRPFSLPKLTDAQVAAIRENRIDTYATAGLEQATTVLRATSVGNAVRLGVGETRDAIVQVYLTVRAMFRGGISPRELSGPVGILAVGYKFAEAGATRLLWFLSIISANLAVMNFLPIPVVDGGLFTFLIIEKLKGSPISQRTQSIAQVVGLVLLLSVFVFATWQDVSRIPQLFH